MVKSKSVSGAGHYEQSFEKTVKKELSCRYLLFLPEGYGEGRKLWPMILFLHGAGERGNDLEAVKAHGPPKIVEQRRDFPFVVVSPQCPEDAWWSEQEEVLIGLLDYIMSHYEVDTERVYLTGLSMGGFGTWHLACHYPERFAAIAPICGGGEPLAARRLKDMPVWAFHGAKDEVVPLKRSEEMVEAVREGGGDVKLTVYPDAEHDSWTETYDNEELYEWFLRHRRSKGAE